MIDQQCRNPDIDPRIQAVLDFWFGAPDSPDFGEKRKIWYQKDPAFDAELRARFETLQAEAVAGILDGWASTPTGTLALLLLLDQISRNLFRDDPKAFAADSKALELARQAVAAGQDQEVPPVMRTFFYLPFEHSEDLADQIDSLRLFTTLPDAQDPNGGLAWARKHHAVIARFGRFPHRNAVLERPSTQEEIAFLAQPGSSF